MHAVATRAAVAGAAGALVLGLGLAPVDAQVLEPSVSVTGTATCNLDTGHETYALAWSVTNATIVPVADGASVPQGSPGAVDVESAVQSGAWTGPVTITPSFLETGDTGTGTDGPVPNTAGTVTLTVSYFYGGAENGTATGTIELDGTCTAPEPPAPEPEPEPASTVTTRAATAPAVAARPTFTG
jgi:hypothetical protein